MNLLSHCDLWGADRHELVKYMLFWMNRLLGSADDTACLSDRLCSAHSLHSCVVQIGLISCQLVAEHHVRPTTRSASFSQATFDFLRHRTFLKFGLKEGREMQLLVNRDSLLLQIYPGSGNFSPQDCSRPVCVSVCVVVWMIVAVPLKLIRLQWSCQAVLVSLLSPPPVFLWVAVTEGCCHPRRSCWPLLALRQKAFGS